MSRQKKHKRSHPLAKLPSGQSKVSAMLIEIGGNYISAEKTLERQQIMLSHVVNAWNLAVLPPQKRKIEFLQIKTSYLALNPLATNEELQRFDKFYEEIIAKKLELCPTDLRIIINADILEINGKKHITVATMPGDILKTDHLSKD
ncbi:MAG: hypothetical protein HPY51_19110 [Candidatus Omnitrophica bacterium]|nr:hypothetical protein [Candidatus Omnitrophota bacterium]